MSTARARFTRFIATALAATGLFAVQAASAHAYTTHSGQATVVRATVNGTDATLADTGALSGAAMEGEDARTDANVPGLLTANVLHATTVGQAGLVGSDALTGDLNLTLGDTKITADVLVSRAGATCAAGAFGSTTSLGLTVNGQPVDAASQPNQTIQLSNGKVVINEQIKSGGSITVNALHVVINGLADVVIASARAGVSSCSSGPDCAQAKDRVTGGGWITGTPSGARGTFGVAGGVKGSGFWGHLEYQDHGTGMNAHGTGVTAYSATGTTTRHIEGTVRINGQDGFTYKVDVTDNGEPGRFDKFTIELSNGYRATGTLRGGNIQLHVGGLFGAGCKKGSGDPSCPSGAGAVTARSYNYISATRGVHSEADMTGQTAQGDFITVNFTVHPACTEGVELSFVSYQATAEDATVFNSSSGTFGPGDNSLSVDVPPCQFRIYFVRGPVIAQLEAPFNEYAGREIDSDAGGITPCPTEVTNLLGVS